MWPHPITDSKLGMPPNCLQNEIQSLCYGPLENQDLALTYFTISYHSSQQFPAFLALGTHFMKDNLCTDPEGGGDGFRMIQVHYIYCVLYFYYCYIVIYNEIITQIIIMQNQWETWACFPATTWSHLGIMGDNDTQTVLLMYHLLHNLGLVAVTAENCASQR